MLLRTLFFASELQVFSALAVGNTNSYPVWVPGFVRPTAFQCFSPQCVGVSSHVCSDQYSVKDSRGPLWRSGDSRHLSLPLSLSQGPSSSMFCPQILAVSTSPSFTLWLLSETVSQPLFQFPFVWRPGNWLRAAGTITGLTCLLLFSQGPQSCAACYPVCEKHCFICFA